MAELEHYPFAFSSWHYQCQAPSFAPLDIYYPSFLKVQSYERKMGNICLQVPISITVLCEISEWNVGYLLKGLLIPKTYIRIILKIIAYIALPLFFRT